MSAVHVYEEIYSPEQDYALQCPVGASAFSRAAAQWQHGLSSSPQGIGERQPWGRSTGSSRGSSSRGSSDCPAHPRHHKLHASRVACICHKACCQERLILSGEYGVYKAVVAAWVSWWGCQFGWRLQWSASHRPSKALGLTV